MRSFHCNGGALLLLVMLMLGGCREDVSLQIGEPVDNFRLPGLSGDELELTRLKGHFVLVNIWAPWCKPCRAEMPSLDRLTEQMADVRLKVIGLTVDDRFAAEEFLRKTGIRFPNYFDASRELVGSQLAVNVFPQTLLIDPDGILRARIIGAREWDSPENLADLRLMMRRAGTDEKG